MPPQGRAASAETAQARIRSRTNAPARIFEDKTGICVLIGRNHVPSNQGEAPLKTSVESNFEDLKKALDKAITSIRGTDSDSRNSWISALEGLYKTGLEQLDSESE